MTITNFVLVDVVTGQPFNRPVGTTGLDDTPHNQPVAAPQPAPTPAKGRGTALDRRNLPDAPAGRPLRGNAVDRSMTVTHRGNTLTINMDVGVTFTGSLNADGSFQVSGTGRGGGTMEGVFSTEGGRTVIRDVKYQSSTGCTSPWWAPSSERHFTRLANDDHDFTGVAVASAQRAVSHQAYKAARSRPFGFAVTTSSAFLVHVSMGAPSSGC